MVILFNFNTYLGGGETLLVRFSSYLHKTGIPFHAYCMKDSFIAKQMEVEGVPANKYTCISKCTDYPYLTTQERELLLDDITSTLPQADKYQYLSFCLRELYMLMDLNKRCPGSISHLILHNQDYLYLGRTLTDGLMNILTGKRQFNNKKNLDFNRSIIELINSKRGLIPMSWIISQLWKKEIGLDIPEDMIVSLPSFSVIEGISPKKENNKKIIFIGRLVDFKFASLFAMFNYIKRNPSYHLTVVGKGDKERALNYIYENGIPSDNIHFVGEVSYSVLPKIIAEHSIGYAAGTSIIECAQQGIPVIMALQYNANKPFKRDICGGLFYKTSKGNLGEDLCIFSEDSIEMTIDDTIKEIETDYALAAKRCYEYVQNEYSNEKNFEEYLSRINACESVDTSSIKVPVANAIRRYLFFKSKNQV